MEEKNLVTIPAAELRAIFEMELEKADGILEACAALEQKTGRTESTELIGGIATALKIELTDLANIFDGPLDNTRVTHLLALDPDEVKH